MDGSYHAAHAGAGAGPGARGKVKALIATPWGGFVLSHKGGALQHYSEAGRLLWSVELRSTASCLAISGQAVWAGCVDGRVRVVALNPGLNVAGGVVLGEDAVRSWQAHLYPVVSLAAVGGTVYSLASDGAVRGWPASAPSPALLAAWRDGIRSSLRPHRIRLLTGSWNVNETRPRFQALRDWLGRHAAPKQDPLAAGAAGGRGAAGAGAGAAAGAHDRGADLVCVALQEVEVGTTSVAWDAAISVVNRNLQEKVSGSRAAWGACAKGAESMSPRPPPPALPPL